MAVLGEELGFAGFLVLMSLYGYLVLRGLQIANRAENTFQKILALGLRRGPAPEAQMLYLDLDAAGDDPEPLE